MIQNRLFLLRDYNFTHDALSDLKIFFHGLVKQVSKNDWIISRLFNEADIYLQSTETDLQMHPIWEDDLY